MKTIIRLIGSILPALFLLDGQAQFNFSSSPVWQVSKNYPTGIGWADFDHNGYPDLAVSAGLDIVNGPTLIYDNDSGILPATAGWTSVFLAPGCNIYLNDFDHNGDVDIAVASLGLTSNGMLPVPNYIFMNHSGMPPAPGWLSQPGNAFSCAGGDIDGDGDIDLAFARGDYATSKQEKVFLFINTYGSFDSIPEWQSDTAYFGTDIAFADVDLDGDLDLALGARTKGILIFYNENGILETSPSWHSGVVAGARQMAFGDVDNDGYPDLAVASPGEKFFLFKNINGIPDTIPQWVSLPGNEPSAVAWADADGDGDLDLAAGSWNSALGIFENINGILSDTFAWSKPVGGGTQQIAWADYDKDDLIDTLKTLQGDGHKKLFYIGKQVLHQVSSADNSGIIIPPEQYCYDLIDGWISFATAPLAGETISLHYSYSKDPDLALTNWGAIKLFENLNTSTGIHGQKDHGIGPRLDQNEPNPCRENTSFNFFLPGSEYIILQLYNSQGKIVAKLLNQVMPGGEHRLDFSADGLPAGLYTCAMQGNSFRLTRKMIIL